MRLKNYGAIIEGRIRYRFLQDYFTNHKSDILLDLGCGPRPYYELYKNSFVKTIGADLPDSPFPKENIDIFCSATDIPLESESISTVLCTEVMHDMPEPRLMLREVNRILKKNGQVILTTPFVVPIVDGQYDHYRFTQQGLQYLLNAENFDRIKIIPVGNVIAAMLTLYIKPWLKLWSRLSKAFRLKIIYSDYNPLFFITVVLPQYMYLFVADLPLIRKILRKFSYGPIGYISIAQKK